MQQTKLLKPKYPTVRYIGLAELDLEAVLKQRIDALVVRSARKLCRHVKQECGVTIHCKVYDAQGKNRKYSVHIRFTAPGLLLVSGNVSDWDMGKAVHVAFDGLETRLKNHIAKQSFGAQESTLRRKIMQNHLGI